MTTLTLTYYLHSNYLTSQIKQDFLRELNKLDHGFKKSTLNAILFRAASIGDAEVCKLAIAIGADINYQTDPFGTTPLMAAVKNDQKKAFDVLVAVPGVNLDAQDINGETALMHAAFMVKKHGASFAQELCDRGCDTNVQSHASRYSALHYACDIYGDLRVIPIICKAKGTNLELRDDRGRTAFMESVRHGEVDRARLMLAAGAKIDVVDCTGRTALCNASDSRFYPQMVAYLISQGASVDTTVLENAHASVKHLLERQTAQSSERS